jgi:hypothetical protein
VDRACSIKDIEKRGAGIHAPRNNLSALERLPYIFFDFVVSNVVADLLLHCKLPSKYFLVRESVK